MTTIMTAAVAQNGEWLGATCQLKPLSERCPRIAHETVSMTRSPFDRGPTKPAKDRTRTFRPNYLSFAGTYQCNHSTVPPARTASGGSSLARLGCRWCYGDDAIRSLYDFLDLPYGRREEQPPTATEALPGSRAKLDVLAAGHAVRPAAG